MAKLPAKRAQNKVGTFNLVSKFGGYRARKDQTMEDPGILVAPSQNVVLNTAGRIESVKGYVLDGVGSVVQDSGILSHFDFSNFKSDVRNMRAGFLTAAGNDGKLQYRYQVGTTVNWVDLKTALTNVRLSFCEYWDTSALVKKLLWVDGSNNVFAWNGAVTQLSSTGGTGPSSYTLTKTGTTTWAQEGFAQAGTRSVVINGNTYTYTGGEATTTLTGVSPNPGAEAANSIVHQSVVTTALSAMTSILATFAPTLIGCGRANQVYLGSSTSNNLYISKVNDFTNYAFTSPTRLVGEGNLIPLDAPPTGFVPMESRESTTGYDLYISEGADRWAVIQSVLSSDLTAERQLHVRVKTGPLQGAKSGRLVGKMKNHIIYVGNDNVANFLGFLSYQYVPEIVDFSHTIIDDMKAYDFTDASIFYYRNYVYIAIPKAGLVRAFNMTDQTKQSTTSISLAKLEDVDQDQPWFWEAPITYPISGFYTVNGDLYGHSYTTSESYKLFTGHRFNDQNIAANATFAFTDLGDRTQSKGSDSLWVEGYIAQNTTLTATVAGDLGALSSAQSVQISGLDRGTVSYGAGGHALGKNPLGSEPLGGAITQSSTLPAWFHVIKTYPVKPQYLEQLSFSTEGVDLEWQLICFGTNASNTNEGNNNITD